MKLKLKGIHFGIFAILIGFAAGAAYYFTLHPSMPNASSINGGSVVGQVTGKIVGEQAPDFSAQSVDLSSGSLGKNISLADLKATGKPTVFYFWATWCPFCRDELTKLKAIYPQYQDKINFVGVDVDVEETPQQIASDVNSHGFYGNFTIADVQMLQVYKIYDTTTKYVITRNGTILFAGSGEISNDYWANLLNHAISA